MPKKISQWHLLTGLGGRQTKEFFFLYIQWYFGVCHFGVHFWHLVSDLSFKNYCIILKTYRQTWKTKNKKTSSEVSHTVSQSLLSFTTLSSLTKTAQHEQSDDETTDGCVRCRQWNDKTALALEKKKAKSAHLHFSVTILVNIHDIHQRRNVKIIHFISYFFFALINVIMFFFFVLLENWSKNWSAVRATFKDEHTHSLLYNTQLKNDNQHLNTKPLASVDCTEPS